MSTNTTTSLVNQFTKEAIKMRMMQHASNLWGVKSPSSLDPLVKLLIEAFSTEIYRAANETQNIEGRILDKIAHMLTPNLLTTSKPAHAIMQAYPLNAQYRINPFTKFSVNKRLVQQKAVDNIKNEEIQINFSPTSSSKLIKGRIGFIASSYQIFSIDSGGYKQPLLRTSNPLPWATCWIGLQTDRTVTNLDDLPLYFDFPSYESKSWIYQLLPLCKFYYQGKELLVKQGRSRNLKEIDGIDIGKQIFSNHDVMNQLHEDIEQYYDQKFITIENCAIEENTYTRFPTELEYSFDKTQIEERIPKNLIWIKIQFPPNYRYEMLSDCFVAINCFPVSNRNLLQSIFSYKGLNSILPLRTDIYERFLAVNKVADASGREFTEIPYSLLPKSQGGFYSIRHGGVERFDQRSAHDMVSYLLELTRDEVAAFASLDQTFIRTSLETLAKHLKQIENKTAQLDKFIKQSPSYLIVEPISSDDNIQVDYWVTQGVEANNIRQGTEFNCQNNPDVEPMGAVLVSESFGGREPLQAGDRLNMYRYALSSKNRLVTLEDIRNFCKAEMGNSIKEVKFSKGLEPSPHPNQGYIRSIKINLYPQNVGEFSQHEWKQMAYNLLIKIRNLSPEGYNYSIAIEF